MRAYMTGVSISGRSGCMHHTHMRSGARPPCVCWAWACPCAQLYSCCAFPALLRVLTSLVVKYLHGVFRVFALARMLFVSSCRVVVSCLEPAAAACALRLRKFVPCVCIDHSVRASMRDV